MPDELLEIIRTSLSQAATHIVLPIIIMFVIAGVVLLIIKSSLESLAIKLRRKIVAKKRYRNK